MVLTSEKQELALKRCRWISANTYFVVRNFSQPIHRTCP